jgi:GNAT superfamily N-acetyltransferase
MTLELRELAPAAYAQLVLPHTFALWSQGRSMDAYVAQTTALANSRYGRKHFRTFALSGGGEEVLLSTFKRYEREARIGAIKLRGIGIGAVFTPEEQRGHGYASAMLGMALDDARRSGFDFAYLFSDIHPQFYKDLGFVELPSRTISLRADALSAERITVEPLTERDWTTVRACFEVTAGARDWGLVRPPSVWDWIRMRMRGRHDPGEGQPFNLVARTGRSVAAYVIGVREPKHDAYVFDEFGYADERAQAFIIPLLRSAAGDLRRIVSWLPPEGARGLLPRGSVRRRTEAIWMLAPLTANGRRFLERAQTSGSADGIWALDHI